MPLNPVLGQIMPFAGSVVPKGWALCNGALLPINQYSALFSLIGTYYGGNGTTNFALPDLRGRAILGSTGGGSYPVGMLAGTPTVPLSTAQLPAHNHMLQTAITPGAARGTIPPTGKVFGTNTEPTGNPKKIFLLAGSMETALAVGTNVMFDGGGAAHNNMQPYLTISYLIAMTGTYPSRN